MTTTALGSGANGVSGPPRNEQHQASAQARHSPRVRPRRFPIILMIAAAITALYGGFHLLRGRDRVEQGGSSARHAPFSRYEVVFNGDRQGQPTPLAPHDPRDLLRWQVTAGSASPSNAGSTDDPARVHLYLSGRIALISRGTRALVLQENGQWRRVQILTGRHRGLTGYVGCPDASRSDHA